MRSINRFITLMKMYENHIYVKTRRYDKIEYLLEYIFLPYCLGEQIFNTNNYNDFTKGIGYEEFYKYIDSTPKLKDIIDYCLYSSTSKEERNIKGDLKIFYDAIYNQNQEYFSIKVGELHIRDFQVKYFYELCTMLSDFIIE